jgi:hypothetical protein
MLSGAALGLEIAILQLPMGRAMPGKGSRNGYRSGWLSIRAGRNRHIFLKRLRHGDSAEAVSSVDRSEKATGRAGDTFSPAEAVGLRAYTNPSVCGATEGGQMSRRSKKMRKRMKQRLAAHAKRLKR